MTRLTSKPKKDLLAISFVLGLIAWYLGGSAALDRLLDAGPIIRFTLLLAGLAALLGTTYELMQGRAFKHALTQGVLLAAVCALLGSTLGALVNRHADRTQARREEAVVTGFKTPSKGPTSAVFEFVTRSTPKRFSLHAGTADGCREGSRAALDVGQGFFGMPWVVRVSCRQQL
jgi:hypothetical protein